LNQSAQAEVAQAQAILEMKLSGQGEFVTLGSLADDAPKVTARVGFAWNRAQLALGLKDANGIHDAIYACPAASCTRATWPSWKDSTTAGARLAA